MDRNTNTTNTSGRGQVLIYPNNKKRTLSTNLRVLESTDSEFKTTNNE